MYVMHLNTPVLYYDFTKDIYKVLDDHWLPISLRHWFTSKPTSAMISLLRDWLSSRMLTLFRNNSKVILESAGLTQSLRTDERIDVVETCLGLSFDDNYWLTEDLNIKYSDVCLRKNALSDISYIVAILGKHVSATVKDLSADISSKGIFPKYWKRDSTGIYLYKTDNTNGLNVEAECRISTILDSSNIPHVKYQKCSIDGRCFSKCECFGNDSYDFASALEVRDYCNHNHEPFTILLSIYPEFTNMVAIDYIFANTDRHIENWGMFVYANDNFKFAPLFDFNQATISDTLNTDISDLIYEPLGIKFRDVPNLVKGNHTVVLDINVLTSAEQKRYSTLS